MQETPYQTIQRYFKERAGWSDAAILDELVCLPPLPDETSGFWFGTMSWEWQEATSQEQLTRYLALADHVAERRLWEGVRLLLERASFGDFGETMRGMHHIFEAAFKPRWKELADLCATLLEFPRYGTQLWATDELFRLNDTRPLPLLFKWLYEPNIECCQYACFYLRLYGQNFPEIEPDIRHELMNSARYHRGVLNFISSALRDNE